MAYIQRNGVWQKQVPLLSLSDIEIDESHWLASSLIGAFLPGRSFINFAGRREVLKPRVATPIGLTPDGPAAIQKTGGAGLFCTVPSGKSPFSNGGPVLNAYAVFWRGQSLGGYVGNYDATIAGVSYANTDSAPYISYELGRQGSGLLVRNSNGSGSSNAVPSGVFSFGFGYNDYTNVGQYMLPYINGKLMPGGQGYGNAQFSNTAQLTIGGYYGDAGRSPNIATNVAYFFDSNLIPSNSYHGSSAQAQADLAERPYALFRKRRAASYVFMAAAAPSGSTGSGAAIAGAPSATGSGSSGAASGGGAAITSPGNASGAGSNASTGAGAATTALPSAAGTGGAGAASGTGAATASPATAAGQGAHTSTGSGAATAPNPTASGTSQTGMTSGSGNATAGQATASGAGDAASAGHGAATALAPSASGVGTGSGPQTSTGTGSAIAGAPSAEGAGTVTAVGGATAVTASPSANGAGVNLSTGSAGATAQSATAIGAGSGSSMTGTGAAIAGAATATGEGANGNIGSGGAIADTPMAHGAGAAIAAGTGSAIASAPIASGIGGVTPIAIGSGNAIAGSPSASGSGAPAFTWSFSPDRTLTLPRESRTARMSQTLAFTAVQGWMPVFATPKDPSDIADYLTQWDGVLATGDTIAGIAPITATPSDLVISAQAVQPGLTGPALGVGFRLSGGTAGLLYTITIEITTTAGAVFKRSVQLPCATR